MMEYVQWLQTSPLSLLIRRSGWLIPAMHVLHILATGLVLSALIMINHRVWGWSHAEPSRERARRFLPWLWISMLVLTVSGIVITLSAPRRTLLDPSFQIKMAMMGIGLAATLAFGIALRRNGEAWDSVRSGHRVASTFAAFTLVLWIGVTLAGRGRWIVGFLQG
jgi:hypothetical protein